MTEANTDIPALMRQIGDAAKAAAQDLFTASTDAKNRALREAAASIRDKAADLKAANDLDMAGGEKKGLTAALLDRSEARRRPDRGDGQGPRGHRRPRRSGKAPRSPNGTAPTAFISNGSARRSASSVSFMNRGPT